jgi:hypothetical protein
MFRFFGIDYAAYHRRVPSGIPFIVTPGLAGDFPAPESSSVTPPVSTDGVVRPQEPSYLSGVVPQTGPAAMLRRTPSIHNEEEDDDE